MVGDGTARTAQLLGFTNIIVPPVNFNSNPQDRLPPSMTIPQTAQGKSSANAVQLGLFLVSHYHSIYSNSISNHQPPNSFPDPIQNPPFLLFSSKIRQETLTSILSHNSIPFEELFCYNTIPNPNLWSRFPTLLNSSSNTLPIAPRDSQTISSQDPNPHTFHVIFSPSGVDSILTHVKAIFQYLYQLANSHQTDNSENAHHSDFLSCLTWFTSNHPIFIAIGVTTQRALLEAQNQLLSLQEQLKEIVTKPLSSLTESSVPTQTLIDLFLSLRLQPDLTCLTPSPAGVKEQVDNFSKILKQDQKK